MDSAAEGTLCTETLCTKTLCTETLCTETPCTEILCIYSVSKSMSFKTQFSI